jgi:hypothetical protein
MAMDEEALSCHHHSVRRRLDWLAVYSFLLRRMRIWDLLMNRHWLWLGERNVCMDSNSDECTCVSSRGRDLCPVHERDAIPLFISDDMDFDFKVAGPARLTKNGLHICAYEGRNINLILVMDDTHSRMRVWDLLIYGGAVALTVAIIVWGLLWWMGVLRY